MPTALIIGGSGKVARLVTGILVARPNTTVYSVIRNPDQSSSLSALGAKPVVQSIEDSSVEDLTKTFKSLSPDVIIWSAGAGSKDPERMRKVDYEGAVRSFDAAVAAGIKRYIIVSSIDVRDRENKPVPSWYTEEDKKTSDEAWGFLGTYFRTKFDADRDLVTRNSERKLDYTIIRPTFLSDEPAAGKVGVGSDLKFKRYIKRYISREDVARVIVAVWEDHGTIGKAFDVTGGDTDIKEAVAKVGKEGIDNFEGYY